MITPKYSNRVVSFVPEKQEISQMTHESHSLSVKEGKYILFY